MALCAIVGCGHRTERDKEVSFFRMPAVIRHQGERTLELTTKRRQVWLARIRREDLRPKQYYINIHSCVLRSLCWRRCIKLVENTDWAPSLKLGYEFTAIPVSQSDRDKRAKRRRLAADNDSTRTSNSDLLADADVDTGVDALESGTVNKSVSVQTELTFGVGLDMSLTQDVEQLRCELKLAKEEIAIYKESMLEEAKPDKLSLTVDNLKDNDKMVNFYTGLNTWELFKALLEYVQPYLKTQSVLSPFQQFLITLMRIRLNLSGVDLGYRFGVHFSTISHTFLHVLEVLHVRLKPLIMWPERDGLQETMPMVFRKHFPKCVAIIDCFEVFIDRPTHLLARAQTYSSYKHHNTVKYLIAITPQGTISFISVGWGGRASDKYITEHSQLLTNLVPGDILLADRGFDIGDSVGLYCTQLKTPAFTKGKSQLEGVTVEQTRAIANVRIHVERVIGNNRKKYSILSATQPINFVTSSDGSKTTLDKIIVVSCALISM